MLEKLKETRRQDKLWDEFYDQFTWLRTTPLVLVYDSYMTAIGIMIACLEYLDYDDTEVYEQLIFMESSPLRYSIIWRISQISVLNVLIAHHWGEGYNSVISKQEELEILEEDLKRDYLKLKCGLSLFHICKKMKEGYH